MDELDSESFRSVLEIVKRAKNDSEKFASLLVVCKLLKADSLTVEMKRQVFNAVGLPFPLRLIKSNQDDENGQVLVDLGISVLSSFITDQQISNSPEIVQTLPVIFSIFKHKLSSPQPEKTPVFLDCLQIICTSALNNNCFTATLRNNGVAVICQCYEQVSDVNVRNIVWVTLLNLVKSDPVSLLEGNNVYISQILCCISECIKNENSSRKFELFSQLSAFLEIVPETCSKLFFSKQWISLIVDSLFDVLGSRLGPYQRVPALTLCHALTGLYDLEWITLNVEHHHKFVLLLTRLTNIEINMIVYENSKDGKVDVDLLSEEMLALLMSCFSILECVCSDIAKFDQDQQENIVLTFDDIKLIKPSLDETIKVISDILSSLQDNNQWQDLGLACMRFLGSWLNVNHFAASKTGIEILQIFLTTFKHYTKLENFKILLKICTPALMNYIEIPEALDIIAKNNVVTFLCGLILTSKLGDEELLLTSQCLIAYAVESKECDELTTNLREFCQLVLTKGLSDKIVLLITIISLVLIVWNKSEATFLKLEYAERFFHHVISTLHKLHSVVGENVTISMRYEVDEETLNQMFPMLMNEFTKAAQDENILCLIEKTNFPAKVETIIQTSTIGNVDVIQTYQYFYKSVCKRSIK